MTPLKKKYQNIAASRNDNSYICWHWL